MQSLYEANGERKYLNKIDSIMLGYTPDEACADAAWYAGQKELRHTGIFLTEQMYTYDLTATEIKP